MNTLERQTFVDQLNDAEAAMSELVNYAENLATRLVGYADEAEGDYSNQMPSMGFLPGVGDAASRMSRKIESVRRHLNRIAQALPVEVMPTGASQSGMLKGYQK